MNMRNKLILLAMSTGLIATPVFAQDLRSASEGVVACQTIEDPAEKPACYEAASTALAAILAVPVQQVAIPDPTASGLPTTTQAAASGAAPANDAAVQTASTETDASGSRLPSWIPRITFGSDRDVEKEPDEFETQLTRIQVNRIGRHFFTTAEGHVWRQKKPGEIRAPKTLPADIVLYQNIAGGLQLKIVETNRIYSVSRVE